MEILYVDNHLLVVNKPAGQLVQGDQTGRPTLLDEARAWIKTTYARPGQVFLGLVHRLDRKASGVVVLARTSKAAARLSDEIRNHRPRKSYWALVEGAVADRGQWVDRLERRSYTSQVVAAPYGKEARLNFQCLNRKQGISLVEIDLETGRHHQIRVQFAARGHPILGDRRYGARQAFFEEAIALHARQMVIRHPTSGQDMRFTADPGRAWSAWKNNLSENARRYRVVRQDDNGQHFEVARNLSEQDADRLIADFEQRGHKQTYDKEAQDG
ncbi:MAG: RNA pseudouridine synthase [Desulfuromonadales bacterium]|jgi:23S rRNA pseudouridine1911/1915/1917 synthase